MESFSIWHWIVVIIMLGPMLLGIFVFKQIPIYLRHSVSGLPKVGRLGWSWTYLYFGWLVPIFRGEIGMGLLHLILSMATFGLFQLIWSFLYNKQHLTRLMTSGWELDQSSLSYDTVKSRLNLNKVSIDRSVQREISPHSIQSFGGDIEKTVVMSDDGRWVMAGFDDNGNVIRLSFSQGNPKLSQEGLIIGRDSKSCDLVISDQSVSRRHARLLKRGEVILIEDLNSTNGIKLHGRTLKLGSSSELPTDGDIQIGSVNLSLGRH